MTAVGSNSMTDSIHTFEVDTIVRWARRQIEPNSPPRMNVRLVFGSSDIVSAVRTQLANSEHAWFIVRSSGDPDAVKLRHGRPPAVERPTTVRPDAPIIYLLFWQPGDPRHDRNAQSLADLRAVDVAQILADASSFLLPWEEAIDVQCAEAGSAWKDAERARAHLQAAWRAVRQCLRERRGGRQHSIPFVAQLDFYGRFLAAARVPDDGWASTKPAERARRLLRQWGEALPELSMFHMPALASVLGVQVDPAQNAKRRSNLEEMWVEKLDRILAENIDAAMDFSSLAEAIAGVVTVEKRLAELKDISLSTTASDEEARRALRGFCHDGDPDALRIVDWLFFRDTQSKRPSSLGLKGLLIARGRRAVERPEDRAARETKQTLLAILGIDTDDPSADPVKQYVDTWTQIVIGDPRQGSGIAGHLRSIAAGQPPANVAPPDARALFDRIARLPDTKPDMLERLARMWEAFGEDGEEDEVAASTLLLGLARLCTRQLATQSVDGFHVVDPVPQPGEVLILTLLNGDNGGRSIQIAALGWDAIVRDELHGWMLTEVRRALFSTEPDDEADDESDDEEEFPIRIAVERQAPGGSPQAVGTVKLSWSLRTQRYVEATRKDALMSWKAEAVEDLTPAQVIQALFGPKQYGQGEGRCPPEVAAAWEGYVRSLGREPGCSVMATLAPIGAAARSWVEAWSAAVAAVSVRAGATEAMAKKQKLETQKGDAIRSGQWKDVQRLQVELDALPDIAGTSVPPPLDDVRSLLRACTGTLFEKQQPTRIVLTPHHPLNIRLEGLADIVLCDVLRTLWAEGWAASALDDLKDALETWGLPEPIHTYGSQPNEPLVFDGWPLEDAAFAAFSRLGARRAVEAQTLGVKEVAGVVDRYASLFPAAADRLHVRMSGDRDGRWAWRILDTLLSGNPHLSCDVDLNTDLPMRETTAIERAIQSDDERRRAFELGPEGVPPRVRFRRRGRSDVGRLDDPLHLALVVGDDVEAFRPKLAVEVGEAGVATDLWNPRVLFEETRPELFEAHIAVGDRADGLSRNVARAVGFAMGNNGLVFRERYIFDRACCEGPLAELQAGAHWLILASRQPLYRAVQQAGPDTARLLDFYSATERGRPVHVCVSLNARSADDDLRRLDAALRALLGPEVAVWAARAVITAATRFAPGLAMRCAGAVTTIDVEGLVGLLLTGQEVRRNSPGAVVLSLDQHRRLLARSGQLGDVLAVRCAGDHVSIVVGESKFSMGSVDQNSSPVVGARAQVRSTVGRLQHLAARHPLSAQVRAILARALVHQIHLTAPDRQRASELHKLVEAAADADHPIRIEPESAGVAHVWSMSATTSDILLSGQSEGVASVQLHGRATTLARLRELENALAT
jgi:hypothetical protein